MWNYFWFEPKRSRWTPPYLPWIRRAHCCLRCAAWRGGRWSSQPAPLRPSLQLPQALRTSARCAADSQPSHLPPLLPTPNRRSRLLTRVWGNDVLVRYLQTGEFEWDPLPW